MGHGCSACSGSPVSGSSAWPCPGACLGFVQTVQPSSSLGPSADELPDTSPSALPSQWALSAALPCAGWTLLHPHPITGAHCSHLEQRSQSQRSDQSWAEFGFTGPWRGLPPGQGAQSVLVPCKRPLGSPPESSPTAHVPARGALAWGEVMLCSCWMGAATAGGSGSLHGSEAWLNPQGITPVTLTAQDL